MPLPSTNIVTTPHEYLTPEDCVELYTEPYKSPEKLAEKFNKLDIQEIGVPIDEVIERRIQEERDAELARQLQEQEGTTEEVLLNRDRMLAIEAQDKELAKMLQERERAKVKRARERAKQKALARKQQLEQQSEPKLDVNQLMPDDSYSYPLDVIPHHRSQQAQNYVLPQEVPKYLDHQDDINYSFPADVIPTREHYGENLQQGYSPQKSFDLGYTNDRMNGSGTNTFSQDKIASDDIPPPVRPTQLDLK